MKIRDTVFDYEISKYIKSSVPAQQNLYSIQDDRNDSMVSEDFKSILLDNTQMIKVKEEFS